MPVITNSTYLDTGLLQSLVWSALKRVECKPGIVVQFRRARGRCMRGIAYRADVLYKGAFQAKDYVEAYSQAGRCDMRCFSRASVSANMVNAIRTDAGYFVVWVPEWRHKDFWVVYAACVDLFGIIVHEAKHVADRQAGRKFSRSRHGRRPNWANRPEEVRAVFTQNSAIAALKRGELPRVGHNIFALALQISGHPECVEYSKTVMV